MLTHLTDGIRWVKNHAEEYGIAADQIGLMGASAGGHLACLVAVTAAKAEEAGANGQGPKPDARVHAVAVFFPPTDFLDYGGKRLDPRGDDDWSKLARRLALPQGQAAATDEEATEMLTRISPARLVTPEAPSFLLIHGDADPVVPLQQSERMLAALKQAGVPAELIVKPGGGHPWLTLHEEVQVMADWFDKQLGVAAAEKADTSTKSE